MTRAQRALACAIAIVPLSISGVALVRCHCSLAAYVIELTTALGYAVFVLLARGVN
jgi:hypothetical protein